MSKSAFDPRVIEKYKEPKSLLHFQWGDDSKVYRYALIEIINEFFFSIFHRLLFE